MSQHRPLDDDDLDRLLASAAWPEPSAAQVAALADQWRRLRRRRRRRVWQAVAATLLIAAASLWWLGPTSSEQRVASKQAAQSQPTPRNAEPTPRDDSPAIEHGASNASPTAAPARVRDPSPYERVLLISVMPMRRSAARSNEPPAISQAPPSATPDLAEPAAPASPPAPTDHPLDSLLARQTPAAMELYLRTVADPAQRGEALAALRRASEPPIDRIAVYLENPRQVLRLAAAQALATLDDARAVERLVESVPGIGRQEALMALLVSRNPQAGELLQQARRNVYLTASVRAAEQQLISLQNTHGENLP